MLIMLIGPMDVIYWVSSFNGRQYVRVMYIHQCIRAVGERCNGYRLNKRLLQHLTY